MDSINRIAMDWNASKRLISIIHDAGYSFGQIQDMVIELEITTE